MFNIVIAQNAEADIRSAYAWWRENRSIEQANKWYASIFSAIATLREIPSRCPPAPEYDLLPSGIRQLYFGIGQHPTHGILFTIDGLNVVILRVRHLAQNYLALEDLK